jgi:hypothetical protein
VKLATSRSALRPFARQGHLHRRVGPQCWSYNRGRGRGRIARNPKSASGPGEWVRTSAAASKSFSISSGAARGCRMSIIVLSFASSERSTRLREGLSDGVSIPRLINPLLEGFDPARRPLLFSCGILACCAFKRRVGLVQIWLLRDRQFARTLLNRRKQLRQLPLGDCGYPA